ncbi:MAG TPA: hypothetical protein VHZ99_12345, partial [Steroidobacteraceae bacterium]|nr:hypothetical protein [Steroidobacteraceae bacterium]
VHDPDANPATLAPPELGAHTAAVLQAAGVTAEHYDAMLRASAIGEAAPGAFAWAPVRRP